MNSIQKLKNMATKKKSATASKKSSKKAAKKAAPKGAKQQAYKPQPFVEFERSKPKDGELVEFVTSVSHRGIYNKKENVIYENGVKHTPHAWRKIDERQLSGQEKSAYQHDRNKEDVWNKNNIPQEHRGENLHEQNPDLAAATIRQGVSNANRDVNRQEIGGTKTGDEAETNIAKKGGLENTGLNHEED